MKLKIAREFILSIAVLMLTAGCRPSRTLQSTVPPQTLPLGSLTLSWTGQALTVTSSAGTVLETLPQEAFVTATAIERKIKESRGSFAIDDTVKDTCSQQTVDSLTSSASTATLGGTLTCNSRQTLRFTTVLNDQGERLNFETSLQGAEDDVPSFSVGLRLKASGEEVFGLGEQFTYLNLKGRTLRVLTQEQGIGRGTQPITVGANVTAGSGGDAFSTYVGANRLVDENGMSLVLQNTDIVTYDFQRPQVWQMTASTPKIEGTVLRAASTADALVQSLPSMRPLPEWIGKGLILGIQGGTAKVEKAVNDLTAAQVPVVAVWLQDWVGQRTTTFGKQLWWNWELDRDRYPDWEGLVARLKAKNIRVLTYVNPFLVDVDGVKPNARRNLFQEAKGRGLLVKQQNQEPYLIPNTSFSAGLVDLTNPRAVAWFEDVLRQEVLSTGASGWMADFGEALPFDSVVAEGNAELVHNAYPVLWAKLNREVVDAPGSTTDVASQDLVFFMRAGFTESPKYATLFWAGDQMVSWDEFDGLKSAVTGIVSGGFSGFSLNHSDIGGYTTITNAIGNYHRSRELLLRWMEFAALTPVFRTHEGNIPDVNAQAYEAQNLPQLKKMAQLFAALAPYRKTLEKQAPLPLVRAVSLQYPKDVAARELRWETFLLGPDVLMAPVAAPAADNVNVYFPQDVWVHLWTGNQVDASGGPRWEKWQAPVGEPAIFVKKGSAVATQLLEGFSKR